MASAVSSPTGVWWIRIRWRNANKGYYSIQGHSKSSRSVSIESLYATSYWWL